MSNVPLVRRAIAGAAAANILTAPGNAPLANIPNPLVVDPTQDNHWTSAALERAGSTLKALNRMAQRPPVHILFEEISYTVSSHKGE